MSEELENEVNPAGQRHWLFGINTAVLALVGLIVAIIGLGIAYKADSATRYTFTFGADNTLTSGSRKVVDEIKTKNEKYTLVSLFIDPSDEQKRSQPDTAREQEHRRKQINQLLAQYARFTDKITAEDHGDTSSDEIETRIRDKYLDEIKPYKDAVEGFDEIAVDLVKFFKEQSPAIGAWGQRPGMTPEDIESSMIMQAEFASGPTVIDGVTRRIRDETDTTLPRWSALTGIIMSRTDKYEALISLFADEKKLEALIADKENPMPKGLADFFKEQNATYKKMAEKLKAYRDTIVKLPPLKMQDVLNGLSRNSIVIMGEHSAKVIPSYEIYTEKPDPQRGTRSVSFMGEQAISSALYAIAHPDKVKVVFVTATDTHILEDAYSDMKTTLEQNNFEVLAWSPPSPNPQGPPPTSVAPPAEGAGVVWVVFTPDAPSQQMMMMGAPPPNAAAVVAATRQHMNKGGHVVFMGEASAGGIMAMMGPSGFAYDELIKDSGIEVLSKYTVVQQINDASGAPPRAIPFIQLDHFNKGEITDSIQSLPSVFGPMQSQQGSTGMATIVQVKSPLPAGVEAHVLAATPYGAEFWGESDLGMGDAKFDKVSDFACPAGGIPLAAYSVRNKGDKEKEQRVAVIGAKMLGANFFLELMQPAQINGVTVAIQRFPGNEELMKNTILWAASYENMIAVSPKSSPVARVDVSKNGYTWVWLTLVVLEPLAILAVCLLVLLARWR